MATCKYCGKTGLFLRLNGIGACPDCAKDDNINLQETWERYESWTNREPLYAYYRKKIITDRSMTANGTHLMRLAQMFLDHGEYEEARKLLLDITRRFPEERPAGRKMQFEALRGLNAWFEDAVQQLALSCLYEAQASADNTYDRDAFLAEAKTVREGLGWTDEEFEGVAKLLDDSIAIKNYIESPFIAKYALYIEALHQQPAAPAAEPADEPAAPAEEPAEEAEPDTDGIEVEIVETPAEEEPGVATVAVVSEPEDLPAEEEIEVEVYEEPAEEQPEVPAEAPAEEPAAPAEAVEEPAAPAAEEKPAEPAAEEQPAEAPAAKPKKRSTKKAAAAAEGEEAPAAEKKPAAKKSGTRKKKTAPEQPQE